MGFLINSELEFPLPGTWATKEEATSKEIEMVEEDMVTMATTLDMVTETDRIGRVVEEGEEGTSKEVEEEGTSKAEEGTSKVEEDTSKVEEDTSKGVEEEGTSNTVRITRATSNSSREAIIEVVTKATVTTPEEILDTTIEEEDTTEGATSSGLSSDLRTWL